MGEIEQLATGNDLFDADSEKSSTSFFTSEGLEIVNGVVVGVGTCTDTNIFLGKELLGIAAEAFSGCGQIESITIENGMTTIETRAFLNCTNLATIKIPLSVTEIQRDVFSGCSSLVDLTVPYVCKDIKNDVIHPLGFFFGTTEYVNSKAVSQRYYQYPNYNRSSKFYLPKSLYKVSVLGGYID
jgi:hypothetical protein